MPTLVTAAAAYGDEALADEINTPFRPPDVSGKKMVELGIVEQLGELLGNEFPDVSICFLDFRNDFLPAINDEKDVLQVATHEEVALAAAQIGLQLRGHKQLWSEAPYI